VRRAERRQAWQSLAAASGCPAVFVELQAADTVAAEDALARALQGAAAA
jgi:predicted kinase